MKKHIVPFEETNVWPILAELTDENVLGTVGLSTASPRLTARAILKRDDGMFAVMYAKKFNLYSLPVIRDREHDTNQRKYLQARDVAALTAYLTL